MKIEEEIKQKKFSNAHHRMAINLMFTASWLEGAYGRDLKKYGLTVQQFNTLRILRGQYPEAASVGLIQERMLDKNSNASRLIDKLQLKKLVDRKVCPDDKRQMDIRITAKGLELLTELDGLEKNWLERMSSLSDSEADCLNDLLDKLRG